MTTQRIQTPSNQLLTGNKVANDRKDKAGIDSFEFLINTSMKGLGLEQNKFSDRLEKTMKTTKEDKALDNSSANRAKQNSTIQLKNEDITQSSVIAKEEKATKEEPEKDQAVLSQVMAMLQTLRENLIQAFQLSPEEFDQLLSEQGLTLSDLLEPEQLTNFTLNLNGTDDILSVITNEDLAATLNELIQTVEQIKDNTGLHLSTAQIKELMQQFNETLSSTQEPEQQVSLGLIPEEETLINESGTEETVNGKEQQIGTGNTGIPDQDISTGSKENFHDTQSHNQKAKEDFAPTDKFQTFVDNLVNSSQTVQNSFGAELNQSSQLREIVHQIVENIKISVSPGQSSMELQLNPEHLGKVNLTVQSTNGLMTAKFVVQNEVTKQAIESQMQTLKDTLSQQGIKIEAVEVTVSANAFDQNQNQETGNGSQTQKGASGKKITLEEAMSMSEVLEATEQSEDITGITGSQINYKA